MKKLMALCLSLLMVLSMCSFTAMADGEVDFSVIADGQPQDFVYKKLILGEHTITSSNEAVIKTDGTVIRPYIKDTDVSIVIDGVSRYNLIVKAQTSDVLVSSDFATAGNIDAAPYTNWKKSSGTRTDALDANAANGKMNLSINPLTDNKNDGNPYYGRTSIDYTPATPSGNNIVTFEFDVADIQNRVASSVDIRISCRAYDSNNASVGVSDPIQFYNLGNYGFNAIGGFGPASNVTNVKFSYDPKTGEVWQGDVKCTPNLKDKIKYNAEKSSADVAKIVITQVRFCNAGGGCGCDFTIDNFVEYEVIPESTMLAKHPEAIVETYTTYLEESYVADGGSFNYVTGNLKFAAPEGALGDGATITWTTSDPSVIAADGTVTRDFVVEKPVKITGTLTVPGSAPVVKTHDVIVKPRTIADTSNALIFEEYLAGTSLSSGWTLNGASMSVNYEDNRKFADVVLTQSYATDCMLYNFTNLPTVDENTTAIVLSYDFKEESKKQGAVNNFGFKLNGYAVGEWIDYNGKIYGQDNYSGQGFYGNQTPNYISPVPNEFKNFKIRLDIVNKNIEYYYDGNSEPIYTVAFESVSAASSEGLFNGDTLKAITSASFYVDGRDNNTAGSPALFSIDDLVIYTETSLTGVIASLQDSEKVAVYKNAIENTPVDKVESVGALYDLDTAYAEYGNTGVTVSWASGNTEYISNTGALVKMAPLGSGLKVPMTATITAGSASATATVYVPVVTAGTTYVTGEKFDSSSVKDSEYGNVYELATTDVTTTKTVQLLEASKYGLNHNKLGHNDRIVISADMKFTHDPELKSNSGGINIHGIQTAHSGGALFDFNNREITIFGATTEVKADGKDIILNEDDGNFQIPMPEELWDKEGKWMHVVFDYNVMSCTYNVYADGILLNKTPIVVNAVYKSNTGGSTIRHIDAAVSAAGTLRIDNLEIREFSDANKVEVNAALNAAIVMYGSEFYKPALQSCDLPAKTISSKWVTTVPGGTEPTFDLAEHTKNEFYNNPAYYTLQTDDADAPKLTYKVNGTEVTAINASKPEVVELEIIAEKNGYSEKFTVKRDVAPVNFRGYGLNGYTFNGIWLEGAKTTDTVILAGYAGGEIKVVKMYDLSISDRASNPKDYAYHPETGLLEGVGIMLPAGNALIDTLKVFVVSDDGITPAAMNRTFLETDKR